MTVHGMHREASIEINASPEAVYDLVSDLPRMGEWSPENIGGEWQNGGSGAVGDRFLGHNRTRERAWSVPVMVTVAESGRCFEFVTHPDDGPYVRWTYRLEPSGTGTRVTEIWDVEKLSPGRRSRPRNSSMSGRATPKACWPRPWTPSKRRPRVDTPSQGQSPRRKASHCGK